MKEKKEIAAIIVNPDTGEATDEIYYGDKIVRKSTTDYLQETIEIGKGKRFVKMFESSLLSLANEKLTGNQFILIMIIGRYIRYDSGLIAFDNGVPITKEHLIEISGISRSSVFDSIDNLVTKKIIAKTKVGHEIKYYFNPFIFTKGKRINKTLYSMFEKSKWCKLYSAPQE